MKLLVEIANAISESQMCGYCDGSCAQCTSDAAAVAAVIARRLREAHADCRAADTHPAPNWCPICALVAELEGP